MNELVRDWMTANVISVAPTTEIEEADAIMQASGIRRLAVLEGVHLAGILSQGDVRAAMATAAADFSEYKRAPTVGDLMTPDPITIPETATVALAAKTMLQLKVSGLPVIDQNGKLCGLLSESDLFRYIVELANAREHVNPAATAKFTKVSTAA